MKKISFLILTLFWAINFQTHAQTIYELEDIVISAGNSPILRSQSATPNTIITEDQITNVGDVSIRNLLRTIPGVAVSSSGSNLTQIRIRGGEANHVLVLIDGISASAGDGEYNFSGISALDVERIEVLRGPQTVFFGPSAASGVINIITKSPAREELVTTIGAGRKSSITISKTFRVNKSLNSLTLIAEADQGYDYSLSNGDKDGNRRNTVQFRSETETDGGIEAGITIRSSNENYDSDKQNFAASSYRNYITDSRDVGEKEESIFSLNLLRTSDGQKSAHEVKISGTRFNDVFASRKRNSSEKSKIQYHFKKSISDKKIKASDSTYSVILEGSADRNKLSSSETRESWAVGSELRHVFSDNSSIQLGGRYENGNRYENVSTWKISYLKPITGNADFLFDIGTGVVNPNYFEIYGYDDGFFKQIPNNSLKPERNRSVSVGIKHRMTESKDEVSAYIFKETLVDEIISYATDGTNTIYNSRNAADTSNRSGIEFSGTFSVFKNLVLSSNYTFINSYAADKSREIRRPQHSLNLGLEYFHAHKHNGKFSLSTNSVYNSFDKDFTDCDPNPPYECKTKKLPNYNLVNAGLSYKFGEGFDFIGEVKNLLNQKHYEVWGYNSPGRSFEIRLTKRW